jgi:hypothetical protein
LAPAPIYALFREGDAMPVAGQLNIIGVIPGDPGYNDFWRVTKVTVPDDYEANTLTSAEAVIDSGYEMDVLDVLVNCPVVPRGSTAKSRFGSAESSDLIRGWYEDQVVYYFSFEEAPLMTTSNSAVPVSPIHVTFNKNPDEDGGGPPSGFVTESGSEQTHNVLGSLPGDDDYSPLWMVNVYDNADFDDVSDMASLEDARVLANGVANVNCPVVSVTE